MSDQQTLAMLERRRIEAAILKHVYETLKASHGAETLAWCGGAYSESEGGSNFAQCAEGVSAMVYAEPHAGLLIEQFEALSVQAGGE